MNDVLHSHPSLTYPRTATSSRVLEPCAIVEVQHAGDGHKLLWRTMSHCCSHHCGRLVQHGLWIVILLTGRSHHGGGVLRGQPERRVGVGGRQRARVAGGVHLPPRRRAGPLHRRHLAPSGELNTISEWLLAMRLTIGAMTCS